MCNIRTKYIWAHGAGPKKAAGPMGPKARDPGPGAQGLGPRRLFGPGPMGPYVFCTYVAHMLYIIPIIFIFISYFSIHGKTIYFILLEIWLENRLSVV